MSRLRLPGAAALLIAVEGYVGQVRVDLHIGGSSIRTPIAQPSGQAQRQYPSTVLQGTVPFA
jgi:hypothetical protein